MQKKPSKRPKPEILTISRPDSWSEEDWAALTPRQKALYATNPNLYRPGQSGRKSPGMKVQEEGAAPVPAVQPPNQPPAPAVHAPAFEVEDSPSIQESLATNGLALVNDAFARAARAPASGDPFDKVIYQTLLLKALPMATLKELGKGMSGQAKQRKKALEALLAAHQAQDASFTPVMQPEVEGDEGADDDG